MKIESTTTVASDGPNVTRIGGWIQTSSGGQFWPQSPHVDDIRIEDIAAGLSKICRFNGQCLEFYSVAQHSVYASKMCVPEYALWGLLHDASEAYISDVATPIKHDLTPYLQAEQKIMKVIIKRFGLEEMMPQSVKDVDAALLATEKRDIMATEPAPWQTLPKPYPWRVVPVGPKEAEQLFLDRFNLLTGGKL